jgi:hypothetical protein
MKQLLLLVGVLLTTPSYRAIAQQTLPTPQPSVQVVPPLRVDSAAVLQQLFRHNRRIGLLGLVATTGISTGINALNDSRGWRQAIGGVAIGANTGLLVVGLVERLKFSRKREQETIERLRQHQPLRPYVQRNYTAALIHATTQHR